MYYFDCGPPEVTCVDPCTTGTEFYYCTSRCFCDGKIIYACMLRFAFMGELCCEVNYELGTDLGWKA